jgi:hypothetical protein
LKYTVEGKNISTYATVAPENGEETVKSLYLLFFQPSNNNTGTFIEAVEVTGALSMNTTIPVTFPAGSTLATNGAYNVLAVANLTEGNYLGGISISDWCKQLAGKTEEEVLEEAMAFAATGGTILPEELLMQGSTSKAANTGNISLVLTRNLARFDVSNNKKQTHDLLSVSIWNAYPNSSIFGKGVLDYSSSVGRLRRFYGIPNQDADGDGLYDDIKGRLYAFENEVAAPGDNDNLTTCLIIGLRNRAIGDTTYYRVNIRPQGSAQVLKRNNVYRVTITDVFGSGASSEEVAYTGIGAELGYTINYWDLDDNGLIVQDGTNILAIPTKTVRIGVEGGQFSYSIYTFSSLGQASSLQIKSQTWNPQTNDIQATLNGNTLVINATPLVSGGPDRNGVITLSYAGLETSISVLQSSSVSTFLEVLLPGGGIIPPFGASKGIYSGDIEIRASGAWTAELFGDDGFSLSNGSTPVEKIVYDPPHNVSSEIRGGKYFQVWTHTLNNASTQRRAFVVVSLNSDPVNYVSVIRLIQNPQGGVTVTPDPVTFTVGDYATPKTVTVDGVTSNNSDKEWTATILPGTHDDKFTLSRTSGDGVTSWQTSFDVRTKGQNLSGGVYTATIRVALASEPTTYKDITVTQQSSHFTVSPNSNFPVIAKTGGATPMINVGADPSFHWSATVTMASAPASDGRALMNHTAYLADGNGDTITGIQSVGIPFRVVLPKVYWPNREISGITATVTITLHDANKAATPLTQTFSVTQSPLVSAGLNAANMRIAANPASYSTEYGSLRNTVFEAKYSNAMGAIFSVVNGKPQDNTTYLHAFAFRMGSDVSLWEPINDFIEKEGVTVLSMEEAGLTYVNRMNANGTTLNKQGYKIAVSGTEGGRLPRQGVLDIRSVNTRIYKFLVTNGKKYVPDNTDFYKDGYATEATVIPASAVAIIKRNYNDNTLLSIDPANRIIYIGDLQSVGYDAGYDGNVWTSERQCFLENLALYIQHTAEYGSHFSDMFIDNSNVATPWDPVWSDNCADIIPIPTP